MIRYFFSIHGGTDDPTCITGSLAARKEVPDLRMVQTVNIARDTHGGRRPRFCCYHYGVSGEITVLFFAKDTEPLSKGLKDKGGQHFPEGSAMKPGQVGTGRQIDR